MERMNQERRNLSTEQTCLSQEELEAIEVVVSSLKQKFKTIESVEFAEASPWESASLLHRLLKVFQKNHKNTVHLQTITIKGQPLNPRFVA